MKDAMVGQLNGSDVRFVCEGSLGFEVALYCLGRHTA